MSFITIVLIIIVALLAGMEGILDEFQFHQPLVACTLIGLVSGHLTEGIVLGGSLQMIALGWANVGAAVAPDAALASVASAIIMVLGLEGGATDVQTAISTSIAVAVPLSVAGLFLTMICRTIAIPMVHFMDGAAEKGNIRAIETWHILAILLQGVRIAIPAAALCFVPAQVVTDALNQMPTWLSGGMTVGGGMVAGVFVLAAPVAALAAGGVGIASHLKGKQLRQEKERLYKEALKKHEAIIQALKSEAEADKERLDYLQSLNILLQRAIEDLQKDLGVA